MIAPAFAIGDAVLVVGRLQTARTCLGLFGFVSTAWPDEGKLGVELLTHPALDNRDERRKEARGEYSSTFEVGTPGDFVALTDPKKLVRVAGLKAQHEAEAKKPADPKFEAFMKEVLSPEGTQRRAADEAAFAAKAGEMGQVFNLPGRIARGDKSLFPAYRDPAVQAMWTELTSYAAKGPDACTLDERVRWSQALEATGAASFWSGRPEVRDLVKELDLDPMSDRWEPALYKNNASMFAPTHMMRSAVIRLWNSGAVICGIEEAEGEHTCWRGALGEAPGFLIRYAFRRKLPIPEAPASLPIAV
jgi:hypothetical protein